MPISTRAWVGSKDAARWPFAVSCSQIGCYFAVCAATIELAEHALKDHEDSGPCPYGAKEAQERMPVGKSLREQQWDKLDDCVQQAMLASNSADVKHTYNGMAQGLAWVIWQMDQPYWETVEAVLTEAAKRYRIHTGQEEFSETAGYHYPHHPSVIEARLKASGTIKRSDLVLKKNETKHPIDALINELGGKKITAILRALESNFDQQTLADVYSIPLSAIKRMAAQPGRFASIAG